MAQATAHAQGFVEANYSLRAAECSTGASKEMFAVKNVEGFLSDSVKLESVVLEKSLGWVLPEKGGAKINGRWYTEHALERMAPKTPQVMAKLEARALERAKALGLEFGTKQFKEWMDCNGPKPRGVPPSVVEAEIAYPGSSDIRVILNENGDVITVINGGK